MHLCKGPPTTNLQNETLNFCPKSKPYFQCFVKYYKKLTFKSIFVQNQHKFQYNENVNEENETVSSF